MGGCLCPFPVNLISLLVQNVPSISGVSREASPGESGNGLEYSQGQGHASQNKSFTSCGWKPAFFQSSDSCGSMPSGDCAPQFQVIRYHSVLSPPGSRGAELSGSPELGGRRRRGRGRWGDPAGGEAPTSPSFLVPAAAAATAQLCEEVAGYSGTVTQRRISVRTKERWRPWTLG